MSIVIEKFTNLAEARQQLGIAEGKQVELKAVNEQQIGELTALRQTQARCATLHNTNYAFFHVIDFPVSVNFSFPNENGLNLQGLPFIQISFKTGKICQKKDL